VVNYRIYLIAFLEISLSKRSVIKQSYGMFAQALAAMSIKKCRQSYGEKRVLSLRFPFIETFPLSRMQRGQGQLNISDKKTKDVLNVKYVTL
jgi:hypothetical protein